MYVEEPPVIPYTKLHHWPFSPWLPCKQRTVFENPKKSLIYCERSELRLHIEWTKID